MIPKVSLLWRSKISGCYSCFQQEWQKIEKNYRTVCVLPTLSKILKKIVQ